LSEAEVEELLEEWKWHRAKLSASASQWAQDDGNDIGSGLVVEAVEGSRLLLQLQLQPSDANETATTTTVPINNKPTPRSVLNFATLTTSPPPPRKHSNARP
jgi:hypothetical protein